jgi:hypothetical protein
MSAPSRFNKSANLATFDTSDLDCTEKGLYFGCDVEAPKEQTTPEKIVIFLTVLAWLLVP